MVRRAVIRGEAFDRGSCKLSHEGYQGDNFQKVEKET